MPYVSVCVQFVSFSILSSSCNHLNVNDRISFSILTQRFKVPVRELKINFKVIGFNQFAPLLPNKLQIQTVIFSTGGGEHLNALKI